MRQHKTPKNVTDTIVKHSELFKGWFFKVYFNGKDYANFISITYPTKTEAEEKLKMYLETGKFDWDLERVTK